MLFADVGKALNQISEKFAGFVLQQGGTKVSDFGHLISELEGMLKKEKEEFGVGYFELIYPLKFLSSRPPPYKKQ